MAWEKQDLNDYDRGALAGGTLGFILGMLMATLSGCYTRGEIRAFAFKNNGLPEDMCKEYPTLWEHGFYRRLKDEFCNEANPPPCHEFLSFCDEEAKKYFSFNERDLQKILDANVPERRDE